MTRERTSLSSQSIAGAVVTLFGACIAGVSTPISVGHWVGAAAMILGLVATLRGIWVNSQVLVVSGGTTGGSGNVTEPGFNHAPQRTMPTPPHDPVAGPTSSGVSSSFVRWLRRRDHASPLWSDFDRWLRDVLHQTVGARRVRIWRVTQDDFRLVPLSDDAGEAVVFGSCVPGLLRHVIAEAVPFVRTDSAHAPHVTSLAKEWSEQQSGGGARLPCNLPDWIVPLGEPSGGVLVVGELAQPPGATDLHALADVLQICWCHVIQSEALALAERTDRVSGVLNRIDLARRADEVLAQSEADGEPAAVLALAIEGIRRLDDTGEWELRDWVMEQIGAEMARRLRSDDLVGRFSDDRFVAVLRRLDLPLGQVIARKLVTGVRERLRQRPHACESLCVRCGLTDAAGGLAAALARTFEGLQQARHGSKELEVVPAAMYQEACL